MGFSAKFYEEGYFQILRSPLDRHLVCRMNRVDCDESVGLFVARQYCDHDALVTTTICNLGHPEGRKMSDHLRNWSLFLEVESKKPYSVVIDFATGRPVDPDG